MDLNDARECKKIAFEIIRRNFEADFAKNSTKPPSNNLSVAWGIHPRGNGRYAFALRINRKNKSSQSLLNKLQEAIDVSDRDFDYRDIGDIHFAHSSDSTTVHREPVRPLTAGLSISQSIDYGGSGALGLFVRQIGNPQLLILSCAHVIADPSTEKGQSILQPGCLYGSRRTTEFCIARLLESRCPETSRTNEIDAAIAKIKNENKCIDVKSIPKIGRIISITQNLQGGEYVEKYGPETGLTRGIVSGIEMEVELRDYRPRSKNMIRFTNQIEIEPLENQQPFAAKGDSGSAVIICENENKNVTGLIFAVSSRGYTFANPITPIFKQLNLELA
jgi:hypothetical protein